MGRLRDESGWGLCPYPDWYQGRFHTDWFANTAIEGQAETDEPQENLELDSKVTENHHEHEGSDREQNKQ